MNPIRQPPPLSEKPPRTLAEAVEVVSAAWEEHGALSQRTYSRYTTNMRRFVSFAARHGVQTLDGLTPDVVAAFVAAPGRDRRGEIVDEPIGATRAQRRSSAQAFCLAALAAGWIADNPVRHVPAPQLDPAPIARPLTDPEAERVRFLAGTDPRGIRAVIVNLLLSGACTGEIGGLTASDCEFDGDRARVRLPGSGGHKARVIEIDGRATPVLAARNAWLAEKAPEGAGLCGKTSNASRDQAKIGGIVRRVLISADLDADPCVRPASLTAWAGRRAFERAGRIEDAARLLGCSSLDVAARAIAWDWNAINSHEEAAES